MIKPQRWMWGGVAASLLLGACSDPQDEAISSLGERGYSFDVRDYHRAARTGAAEEVRLFLGAGMAVDTSGESGQTALYHAASGGHVVMVDMLIAAGADPGLIAKNGDSVLMAAARGSGGKVIPALLEAGADPQYRNEKSWSALTAAAFSGNAAAVENLASQSTPFLDEALQLASLKGFPDVIDVLLNAGANVYARSRDDKTALMYAAENGHLEVARLLVSKGANRFALDDSDQTAAQLAAASGHNEVVSYLSEPILPEETPETTELSGEEWEGLTGVEDHFVALARKVTSRYEERGSGADQGKGAPPRLSGAVVPSSKTPGGILLTSSGASETPSGSGDLSGVARLRDYRERHLPVRLEEVDHESRTAAVRVLYHPDGDAAVVSSGEKIADTGLRVEKIEKRIVHSKQGKGDPVDVSQIIVEDELTGSRHLLVRGLSARSAEPLALVSFGDDKTYEVRQSDEFQIAGGAADRFRVVDIRPTQVVIENLATGEAITVTR